MSGEPRVNVGGRTIGRGEPVFIVAEAGVNHDGELETALELVDAAAQAGADAVKFQTFDPDQLVSSGSGLASYQRRGVKGGNGQKEMLSRLRFGEDEHAAIVEHSRRRGIVFLSTPFDHGSAALLARLGVPAFKVGSGELTNLPFLTELTRYSLPILLSTGMSDLDEVGAAVETIRARGVPLVLFHCVSSYPAPDEEANLRAMDAMREAFGVPVGYSDHCMGFDVSLAAVARDACILERHLTLDRERPGPDHAMSMEPGELGELVNARASARAHAWRRPQAPAAVRGGAADRRAEEHRRGPAAGRGRDPHRRCAGDQAPRGRPGAGPAELAGRSSLDEGAGRRRAADRGSYRRSAMTERR